MAIRVSASSALNGSSSSSRPGSRTSARASEARWASPPDRVSGQAPARSVSPTSASAAARRRLGVGAAQPEADVGRDPLPRHQPRLLEGHRRASRCTADLAGHLAVEPGQGAQQRGLARAAAPDQRDELAGRDVEVEPVEDRRGRRRPGTARGPGDRPPAGRSPGAVPRPGRRGASRRHEAAAPCQGPPLDQPDQGVGEQAEDAVDEQARRRSRRCGGTAWPG